MQILNLPLDITANGLCAMGGVEALRSMRLSLRQARFAQDQLRQQLAIFVRPGAQPFQHKLKPFKSVEYQLRPLPFPVQVGQKLAVSIPKVFGPIEQHRNRLQGKQHAIAIIIAFERIHDRHRHSDDMVGPVAHMAFLTG